MPNNDETGPAGARAMTGRKMGQCGGGQGQGRGRGGCFGEKRRCQIDSMPVEEKRQIIEQEIIDLKKELEDLEK
ncbi:MAG: DUF5320 domain-containing protein [Candidatus Moranbacteria bacterium]|nr:DUF5320 domain-containing protein [Candidatus Moranbacteria bacterium]